MAMSLGMRSFDRDREGVRFAVGQQTTYLCMLSATKVSGIREATHP